MSDTTDVLKDVIDKTSNGLSEVAKILSAKAPEAWHLLYSVYQTEGISALIIGAISFVIATMFFLLNVFLIWPWAKRNAYDSDGGSYFVAIAIGIAPMIIFMIISICNVLNPATWMEVLNPQGYAVLQLLHHVAS